MSWENRIDTHTPCVKQLARGDLQYIAQGGQLDALYGPEGWGGVWWDGDPRGRGYTYTNSWFTWFYSRNQYNIAKQLYPNKF